MVRMLTEQEIINNALKEMQMIEDITAQKYAGIAQQITQPDLQNILKGMEMACRSNYKSISQKMSDMAIV